MGQVEGLDAHRRFEHRAQLLDGGVVRAIRTSDRQCVLVEPEHVPAVGDRITGESAHARDPQILQFTGHQWWFPGPHGLAAPELDEAVADDEARVVGEDRIGHVIHRIELDHLAFQAAQDVDESSVLFGE